MAAGGVIVFQIPHGPLERRTPRPGPRSSVGAAMKAAKGLSPVAVGNLAEMDPLHHPHRTSCFPSQGPEREPELELGVRGQ